ncbi:PAS domain-containing protein [Amycolatopsis cynarae]|uniref:PAS domain-containing protein n=1 Tax=Amycolatopsis cynarae TaxID=2995223 RepID=A0ABY7B875_9PSEU|nr:PAS domain-containing protein [Amycolatopsis sp. HUAS 11-8]WAL68346.1 PAS domain-containing protein [Amycolatopsis sp. HUAS 11-8]
MWESWAPAGEAIARLLSPHAEVVLHDPATDRIVAIWNPLSGRKPGDPSLLGELDSLPSAGEDVHGPYLKSLADGRRLSSVSAVLRDDHGRARLVLCINVDRSAFDAAANLLSGFAAPVTAQPGMLFERDWTETVHETVGAYVRDRGTPVDRLTRQDRLVLLARLDAAGIFAQRRSVPLVARTLGASRSAVYQLLAELRKDPRPHADPA